MTPDIRLDGRVALVTGAGRGIGAAAAELLARAGAAVALTARTSGDVQEVADRVRAAGGEALPVPADVADPEQVAAIVERTAGAYGTIDIVVHLAGVVEPMGDPAWRMNVSEWTRAVAVNLHGPFLIAHEALPVMVRRHAGRLLFATSAAAGGSIPGTSAYSSAKAGVDQLVRVLAAELRGSGVTVAGFNPGPADTPTLHAVHATLFAGRPRWGSRVLARTPAEAARLILWLCVAPDRVSGEVISWRDPWVQAAVARMPDGAWMEPR